MEGIVYKQQSYLENDRLVFVYTPKGRITLIAKGSQKVTSNLRNVAQYLNLITFDEKPNKVMYTLINAKVINNFLSLKNDYKKLEQASILFDLLSFVSDNDMHEKIYLIIKDALLKFSKESVLSFGFKLLKHLGYPMNLKPDGRIVKGFNINIGSLVYENTPLISNIDVELTTELIKSTFLPYEQLPSLDDYTYEKLKKFMYDYYEHHTDIKISRK
ncbi:DNA repair protein RecO [Acholeplasma granularum]|uniref:DNA repair protein RecO n=1 Tax=Acholeplasma granularum TaxID=264635 RepID=UPI00046FCA0F|nr:DNA repair protein RecO [Acholeplasma granularum]